MSISSYETQMDVVFKQTDSLHFAQEQNVLSQRSVIVSYNNTDMGYSSCNNISELPKSHIAYLTYLNSKPVYYISCLRAVLALDRYALQI